MADYEKYDSRVDSLVMEVCTKWDPALPFVAPEEKQQLAKLAHRAPAEATKIAYDRTPTGFTRTITIQPADLDRLRNLHR